MNLGIKEYFNKRLDYLECCKNEFETHIDDQSQKLHSVDCPNIQETFFHYEYVIENTFRYTMLVAFCSLLEEAVKDISKQILPDYKRKIETQKSKRINWLKKHMSILIDKIDIAPIKKDVETFYNLITLRNSIVHDWGKINTDKEKKAVNALEAGIFKDGFLYLNDQILPKTILASENIIEHLLKYT